LPAETGGALERVARAPRDEAIVAVAAVVNRATRQARVGVGPAPLFSASGQADEIVHALDGWQPVSDFRASADYRKAMAGVLTRRALKSAENH
jgi:CO/xanthine dehydrogenase FAD-binding subunit